MGLFACGDDSGMLEPRTSFASAEFECNLIQVEMYVATTQDRRWQTALSQGPTPI